MCPVLVLTRKRSETIRIGDQIVVKVIQTGRKTVKIGIEAPANVRVLRSELCSTEMPAQLHTSLTELLRQRQTGSTVKAPSQPEKHDN